MGATSEQPDGTLKVWYRKVDRREMGLGSKLAGSALVIVTILFLMGYISNEQRSDAARGTPIPRPARTLGDRDWSLLIKDPDAHRGEAVKVWACIVQFDTATGTGAFRGNALNANRSDWLLDGENAVFQGADWMLAPYVKDDVVAMETIVSGTIDYDTVLGGSNTAPLFEVRSIEGAGTCGF